MTETLQVAPIDPQEPQLPRLGAVGFLRWAWRQLTSMRTALLLLFLLALASIPGSLFPQRSSNPIGVAVYVRNHPTAGPWLDRLGVFEVYRSAWFSAIYLLLLISLVGCVIPRTRLHLRTLRSRPPAAPRNLERLPAHESFTADEGSATDVLDRAKAVLRRSHYRVETGEGWVAAEKGYLRETGNLTFHLALVLVLVGVAVGSLWGYRGTVIVTEGDTFAHTIVGYDEYSSGRFVDQATLPDFAMRLDDFEATYQTSGDQTGSPRTFTADVTVTRRPGEAPDTEVVKVNDPLHVRGAKVFLSGHGYAPHFTVHDGQGRTVFAGPVVVLPQEPSTLASSGVLRSADARPTQLAFIIDFFPTAAEGSGGMIVSAFPALANPVVNLGGWTGDLREDDGIPRSVYTLDTDGLDLAGRAQLTVGDTWVLPGNEGAITFDGISEWANFQVAHDPGKGLALAGAIAAIASLLLMLVIRRRRLWVRAAAGADGRTVVAVAGLGRTEGTPVGRDVAALVTALGGRGGDPDEQE